MYAQINAQLMPRPSRSRVRTGLGAGGLVVQPCDIIVVFLDISSAQQFANAPAGVNPALYQTQQQCWQQAIPYGFTLNSHAGSDTAATLNLTYNGTTPTTLASSWESGPCAVWVGGEEGQVNESFSFPVTSASKVGTSTTGSCAQAKTGGTTGKNVTIVECGPGAYYDQATKKCVAVAPPPVKIATPISTPINVTPSNQPAAPGMSTGMKVALIGGAVVAAGGIGYFVYRKTRTPAAATGVTP